MTSAPPRLRVLLLLPGPRSESDAAFAALASASAAVSLSVGYVVWLLRGGVLVSTFLSAMPAWRSS